MRFNYEEARHTLLGLLALAEGRPEDAVTELWAGDVGACSICQLPLLGMAYDQAGQRTDSVIALYERYVNTPWMARDNIDWLSLGFVYERLGQIFTERGDNERAAGVLRQVRGVVGGCGSGAPAPGGSGAKGDDAAGRRAAQQSSNGRHPSPGSWRQPLGPPGPNCLRSLPPAATRSASASASLESWWARVRATVKKIERETTHEPPTKNSAAMTAAPGAPASMPVPSETPNPPPPAPPIMPPKRPPAIEPRYSSTWMRVRPSTGVMVICRLRPVPCPGARGAPRERVSEGAGMPHDVERPLNLAHQLGKLRLPYLAVHDPLEPQPGGRPEEPGPGGLLRQGRHTGPAGPLRRGAWPINIAHSIPHPRGR